MSNTKDSAKMKKYFNSNDARMLINTYGFSIFPIHGIKEDGTCTCNNPSCPNIGKHPATPDGFKSASKDIERVKQLWSGRAGLNVGISTGQPSGVFIIDIDDIDAEKELYKKFNIPNTYTVLTGRGKHLYFKYDETRPIRNGTNIIKGVDVRGDGGYVAGAGSNHANGKVYQCLNPLEEFADCPDELYDFCLNKKKEISFNQETMPQSNNLIYKSDGWTIEQVKEHLSYIDPSCGYDEWINVGMGLHEEGLPFHLFDDWSKQSEKYDGSTFQHWKSFNKGGGVSYGTVVAYAKAGGWSYDKSSLKTKRTTLLLNQKNDFVNSDETIDPETGEIVEVPKLKAIDIADIDLDNIPTRKWLFGDIAARKFVTMISASPGAGKSLFSMQIAIHAANNKSFGCYVPYEENIKTWVYNNEEQKDELDRRTKAILMNFNIDQKQLAGKFFINSGEQKSLCIARKTLDNGDIVHTPDYDALKAEVMCKGIDMLIVDPFAETHAVNENSNDEIKQVAALYRQIAFDCNCAVVLVSHNRKGGGGVNSANTHGNPDDIRGGGAQVGVARRVFTMANMDSSTAAKMNVPDEKKSYFVRFDDAKSNITAPADKVTWLYKKSVSLFNSPNTLDDGDSVGVLEYKTPDDIRKMYSESFKTERNLLMTKLAYRMIERDINELTINQSSEILIENKDTDKSDRSLRKELKSIGENIDEIGNIISEGYRCYFSYIASETKSKGNIFALKRHEI